MLDPEKQSENEFDTSFDIRLSGGIVSMNPFKQNNSSARVAMDASHMAQTVVLDTPDSLSLSTGMDYNYADYIFDVKINGDPGQHVRILKVLKKYGTVSMNNSIQHNPTYYVIYEIIETGMIDVSIVPTYYFQHTTFGFKYIFTRAFKQLAEGQYLESGTILSTTPNYDADNHSYRFGLNTNVVLASLPCGIEDGFVCSKSYAERMSARRFGKLVVNYGADDFLLNLYGDDGNYKPFPDIGEKIRDDGVLFAIRKLKIEHAVTSMTPYSLREIDHIFDTCYYGLAGAMVEDITVYHSHDTSTYYLPTGMKDQPQKYYENHYRFFRDIEKFYQDIKRKKGLSLHLSPELHRQIMIAIRNDHKNLSRSNRVTYRKEDIKQYRVEIIYSIKYPLQIGSKLASCHGSKGVIVGIWPDENMPVDKFGNRAEVIFDDTQYRIYV